MKTVRPYYEHEFSEGFLTEKGMQNLISRQRQDKIKVTLEKGKTLPYKGNISVLYSKTDQSKATYALSEDFCRKFLVR